jgi:hypothetical protein
MKEHGNIVHVWVAVSDNYNPSQYYTYIRVMPVR